MAKPVSSSLPPSPTSSSTSRADIVDAAATVGLMPIVAWEVQHPGEQPLWVSAGNWGIFVLLVALGLFRLSTGEWRTMSLARKVIEVALLVAAVPFLPPTVAPLRLLRLVRFLLLGARSLTTLRQQLIHRGAALIVASVAFASFAGSLLMLEFERGAQDSKIESLADSLWWSVATMTTVGYGDLSPTTTGGRVVAVFLMLTGIALFGLTTALLARWLVGSSPDDEPSTRGDLAAVHKELAVLSAALKTNNVSVAREIESG